MKTSILTILFCISTTLPALAVETPPPAQTEDQQKAEQLMKESMAKKPSLEEKRAELKKKHALKKQQKAAAKEAAAKAKATAATASSGDPTAVQTIKEEKKELFQEMNRDDKSGQH